MNIYQEQEIRYENIETGTKTGWLESSDRKNSIQLINICETKNQPAKFRKAYFEQIAIEITKLINSSPQYHDRDGALRSLSASDICCLVRNKNDGSKLETFLKQRWIRCAIYNNSNLFVSLEALYLNNCFFTKSRSCARKIMLSPVFNVDYGNHERLDTVQLDEFEQCIIRWNQSFNRRLWGRMFTAILNDSGLLERVAGHPQWFQVYGKSVKSFTVNTGQNMDGLTLIEYLRSLRFGDRKVAQEMDTFAVASEDSRVQILTMHTSKGLEFPVVFFAGGFTRGSNGNKHYMAHVIDDTHSVSRCISVDESLKEAHDREDDLELRRLYYVAFTRAALRLVLPTFIAPDKKGEYKPFHGKLVLGKNIIPAMRQNWLKDKPSTHPDIMTAYCLVDVSILDSM